MKISELRNKIHELSFDKKTLFNHLKNVKTPLNSINQAPNDCRKYQVVNTYCNFQVIHIVQKIAPESIGELELAPDSDFKVIEE